METILVYVRHMLEAAQEVDAILRVVLVNVKINLFFNISNTHTKCTYVLKNNIKSLGGTCYNVEEPLTKLARNYEV